MSDEIKELKKQLLSTKKNGYDQDGGVDTAAMAFASACGRLLRQERNHSGAY